MKKLFSIVSLVAIVALMSFMPGKDETNYIEVGGNKVATYEKKQCFIGMCNQFEIKDMEGNLLISVQRQEIRRPSAVDRISNPEGNIPYYEWTFYATSTKVECQDMFAAKRLSKFCEEQGLFTKDGISEKGVKNFALKYGTKFTEEKNRTQIIEHR
jgi:hypothetical protein